MQNHNFSCVIGRYSAHACKDMVTTSMNARYGRSQTMIFCLLQLEEILSHVNNKEYAPFSRLHLELAMMQNTFPQQDAIIYSTVAKRFTFIN